MERHHAASGSPYEPRFGFSRAVRVGDRVLVAGTGPVPAAGSPTAEDAYVQMLRCGEIVRAALEDLGATVADVVRTRMFIVDAADADDVGRGHAEVFGQASPAATMIVVAGLLDPLWRIELEAEAFVRAG